MPTYVASDQCDGCRSLDRPACMYICPMDSMTRESAVGNAHNQELGMLYPRQEAP